MGPGNGEWGGQVGGVLVSEGFEGLGIFGAEVGVYVGDCDARSGMDEQMVLVDWVLFLGQRRA